MRKRSTSTRVAFPTATVAALGAPGPALASRTAPADSSRCGDTPGLTCSVVEVPLDRSAGVAGAVPLHVDVLPAVGVSRGAVFLLAGGPGQGSAQTFDLGDPESAFVFRFLFPGYTIVAYDDRGTGRSNPLSCPALAESGPDAPATDVVADCAAQLGPQASFYGTADSAADLDAVRQALDFDRIAILGVSYGTKLALAYAAAYPAHVERLVLDSVVAPDDPFSARVLQAMPGTLNGYCAGRSCAGATADFAGDVVAVANRLAARPFVGRVPAPNGTKQSVTFCALAFLGTVVDADLNPGLAAELPAAVHAARDGDPQPLLHAALLDASDAPSSPSVFSDALYLATVCDDGPFPWQPDTPATSRSAMVQAALAALPAGSFGPFGSWAAGFGGDPALCTSWPGRPDDPTPPAGPLPDVPVLALSGGLDLRTPTAGAASVVARFPQGHLLVVPGVGHSVLTADPSGCAQLAVHEWIADGTTPPGACRRPTPFIAPLTAFPAVGAKRLGPRQTRTVAAKTLREAEAAWLATAGMSGRATRAAGVDGGMLVASASSFTLRRYSIAPGIAVSGHVRVDRVGPPTRFEGSVRVSGAAATGGTLRLRGGTLAGRLGR